MKIKAIAIPAVLLLSLSGVALVAGPASAHIPKITDTCETGVTVTGTFYDGNKVNTWDVNSGGVDHSGTFGNSVSVHFDIPQLGATTHVTANIQDADHTTNYSQFVDENVGPCGTAPKDVPILSVVVHPATCDAGVTYDVPVQNSDVKYNLESDGVTRPVPGTGFALGDGQTLTIEAHVTAAAVAGGDAPNTYSITIVGGDKIAAIDCTTVPDVTHRTTDINGEVTCNTDGVGGGTYNETVTNFTTNPVWNDDTESYDLVETIDAGYPVITPHTVDASLEQCPIHATTVDPKVTQVCDADDIVTPATTENITYAITASDKNSATVTATPADATVLDVTTGWTLQENGTATFQVVYDNSVCPQLPNIPLAMTGTVPTVAFDFGLAVLAVGLTVYGIWWFKRREERLEDEAIDQK